MTSFHKFLHVKKTLVLLLAGVISLIFFVILKTWLDVIPITQSLRTISADTQTRQVTDRRGYPLTVSYQNRWNTDDNLPLYQIPNFLKQSFVLSEDQHFDEHHGIDWRARFMALWQNLHAGHTVRGASTMTEQVVRMIHPRARTLWSKWLETFEAITLEKHFKKADILEFYLNQLPYAANRRGVLQAARYYFNRDLSTLNHQEMLALVVLGRAPSSFDLYRHPEKINAAILRLADLLTQQHLLDNDEQQQIIQQPFILSSPTLPVNAFHFIRYVRQHLPSSMTKQDQSLKTTLDADLQQQIQALIDQRINTLADKNVHNAAVLVADHRSGEILAWVVSGANSGDADHAMPSNQIDGVTTPRQPGSSLKPFLYALALASGWTPATLIDDAPLATAIGTGLHHFKNYSNTYYGEISLREALGNSLNIPALRTIQFVGKQRYLNTLHDLGFSSLDKSIDIYDEGLALGNGEVTLLELVTAYTALANDGVYRPLQFMMNNDKYLIPKKIFSPEVSSLIANILSDSWARRLEFGANSVMNMPVQTAVKTGTSTDYKDAWVAGFNDRYVVGIWMGNLDRTSMNGVTGSTGPALVLRGIFSMLNQHQKTEPLYLSPKLIQANICTKIGDDPCFSRTEYFINGTEPNQLPQKPSLKTIQLISPTDGLQIAIDPRIPAEKQRFKFQVSGVTSGEHVQWMLNGNTLANTETGEYLWLLARGTYLLQVNISLQDGRIRPIPGVTFVVK